MYISKGYLQHLFNHQNQSVTWWFYWNIKCLFGMQKVSYVRFSEWSQIQFITTDKHKMDIYILINGMMVVLTLRKTKESTKSPGNTVVGFAFSLCSLYPESTAVFTLHSPVILPPLVEKDWNCNSFTIKYLRVTWDLQIILYHHLLKFWKLVLNQSSVTQ